MPSQIHKFPIADAIRGTMPKEVQDLMLGKLPDNPGILNALYDLIGETAGSIELAYRRGYDDGLADGLTNKKKTASQKLKQ